MKKLLSLSVIIFTLGLLTFVACKKEDSIEDLSSQSVQQGVSSPTSQSLTAAQAENVGVYIHNGVIIPFEDLNLDDDDTEVFAGFTTNQSHLLVFFNDTEVKAWLNTLPNNIRLTVEKGRSFTKQARQIAVETNAVNYFN